MARSGAVSGPWWPWRRKEGSSLVSFPQPHLSGGTAEPRGKCGTSEQDRGRRKKKEEEEEEGTL